MAAFSFMNPQELMSLAHFVSVYSRSASDPPALVSNWPRAEPPEQPRRPQWAIPLPETRQPEAERQDSTNLAVLFRGLPSLRQWNRPLRAARLLRRFAGPVAGPGPADRTADRE